MVNPPPRGAVLSEAAALAGNTSDPTSTMTAAELAMAGSEEMRIQVRDDGVVELSLALDGSVNPDHLASIVAAVQSSARSNGALVRSPSNYIDAATAEKRNAAPNQLLRASKSTVALQHTQSYHLPPPGSSTGPARGKAPPNHIVPSASTPRLPDRAAPAHHDADPSPVPMAKRSMSTPELGKLADTDGDEDDDPRMKPQLPVIDKETDKTWKGVEYEFSERYRTSYELRSIQQNPPAKNITSRMLSSIGAAFARRQKGGVQPEMRRIQSSNSRIVSSPSTHSAHPLVRQESSHLHSQKSIPLQAVSNAVKGAKAKPRFVPFSNAGPFLEFGTVLPTERAIAEIARFSKLRGFQVWRRPSEYKLRCIRKLSYTHEMHMVILLDYNEEDGVTMIRIRRAKGDKSKTEWWRYSLFHRDIMDRFAAIGHDVLPPEEDDEWLRNQQMQREQERMKMRAKEELQEEAMQQQPMMMAKSKISADSSKDDNSSNGSDCSV